MARGQSPSYKELQVLSVKNTPDRGGGGGGGRVQVHENSKVEIQGDLNGTLILFIICG